MIPYSAAFRSRMVSKLVGPHPMSAQQLSKESGLAQATLSRWLKEASRVKRMTKLEDDAPAQPRQMQDWKPEEKLAIVLEAAGLSEGEVGVLLRSKGIPSALLEEWRQQALTGLRGTQQVGATVVGSKRIKELERELRRKDKALAEAAALLILQKRSGRPWGPRTTTRTRRKTSDPDARRGGRRQRGSLHRRMYRARAYRSHVAALGAFSRRRTTRPQSSAGEQAHDCRAQQAHRGRDQSRVSRPLPQADRAIARRPQHLPGIRVDVLSRAPRRGPPAFSKSRSARFASSTRACRRWSLASGVVGHHISPQPHARPFLFLYLVEDVWSRKILGWDVHLVESEELAADLIDRIRLDATDQDLAGWVLHSDNGGPMKGATMLATLQRLGIVPSFSRPRVSDDNPFAEALFRTLKYCPEYPTTGFASVELARAWVARFVSWYNHEHQHSGIGFVAPAERHAGTDVALLAARRAVYDRARRRHPSRWTREPRDWSRPLVVTLNPEIQNRAA